MRYATLLGIFTVAGQLTGLRLWRNRCREGGRSGFGTGDLNCGAGREVNPVAAFCLVLDLEGNTVLHQLQ